MLIKLPYIFAIVAFATSSLVVLEPFSSISQDQREACQFTATPESTSVVMSMSKILPVDQIEKVEAAYVAFGSDIVALGLNVCGLLKPQEPTAILARCSDSKISYLRAALEHVSADVNFSCRVYAFTLRWGTAFKSESTFQFGVGHEVVLVEELDRFMQALDETFLNIRHILSNQCKNSKGYYNLSPLTMVELINGHSRFLKLLRLLPVNFPFRQQLLDLLKKFPIVKWRLVQLSDALSKIPPQMPFSVEDWQ